MMKRYQFDNKKLGKPELFLAQIQKGFNHALMKQGENVLFDAEAYL